MSPRILVAGIGNVFLGDDGFGSETARRLAAEPFPDAVKVTDYGIRGMHLAFDLLDGYETLVIIDAMPRGGSPGDLVVLEIGQDDLGPGEFDAHGMEPASVLASLAALGGRLPPRTLLVGCEPAGVEEGIGLTPAVEAAVERAVTTVKTIIASELANQPDLSESV